jgi:hypothetical protein
MQPRKRVRLQPLRAVTVVTAVNFFGKQILEGGVPEMGLAARREGTPSPSISGIIELAGNLKLNLGAQSLAGKILTAKNLCFALLANSENGTDALSAHRHGLDDDCAIARLCARSDVTCGCGKQTGRSVSY